MLKGFEEVLSKTKLIIVVDPDINNGPVLFHTKKWTTNSSMYDDLAF